MCDMILNIFKISFAVQQQKYVAAISVANDFVHKQLRKAGFGHITIFGSLHTFAGGKDSNLLIFLIFCWQNEINYETVRKGRNIGRHLSHAWLPQVFMTCQVANG